MQDIAAENLTQYDAVFLASTTGAFLDDLGNAALTSARRQTLLDFVRGGEIYTMSINSWSRDNVRVLTSIDYEKMSRADRAREDHSRGDRDYGLSWIVAKGRAAYSTRCSATVSESTR